MSGGVIRRDCGNGSEDEIRELNEFAGELAGEFLRRMAIGVDGSETPKLGYDVFPTLRSGRQGLVVYQEERLGVPTWRRP